MLTIGEREMKLFERYADLQAALSADRAVSFPMGKTNKIRGLYSLEECIALYEVIKTCVPTI